MTTKSVETTVNHLSTLLRDKFGIQDLQDRLIFTACALIIQNHSPQDLQFSNDDDFATIKSHMIETLVRILKSQAQETLKLDGLIEPSIFIFEAGIKHPEHKKINGYPNK